jgi:hypothetical protein
VNESEKHLTEAEKQVLRLEQLRSQKERESKLSAEKTYLPAKTLTEKTVQRLQAMKERSRKERVLKTEKSKKLPKIEGKLRSAKLSHLQVAVLERLKAKDKKLGSAAVIRIALNRLFDIENTFDENELEGRIFEVLRQFDTRS